MSRDAAEKALRTIRDLESQYAAAMAPDKALSAAVAETARIMKEAAEREKARTARQILTVARVMDRPTRTALSPVPWPCWSVTCGERRPSATSRLGRRWCLARSCAGWRTG